MNAARRYLKTNDLSGVVFVTSGLGGMSGAQAKAAVIAGCVGVVAEVRVKDLCVPLDINTTFSLKLEYSFCIFFPFKRMRHLP